MSDDLSDVLDAKSVRKLIATYGKLAGQMIAKAQEMTSDSLDTALMKLQLDHALDYEAVAHPIDFMERRTGWLYYDIDRCTSHLEAIGEHIAKALQYDEDRMKQQLHESRAMVDQLSLKEIKNLA